ncbi:fungal-specific transcription factor domain-containing protein [Xylaria sp. FL0064]|nr:fungal-specific transcription factor domain-containing protein [Xylaria sp. FL0064]
MPARGPPRLCSPADFERRQGAIESKNSRIPNSLPPIGSAKLAVYARSKAETSDQTAPALEQAGQNASSRTDLYFLHITSLSLFHRPAFERCVYVELMPEQASTLLASMFCLAARYAHSGDSSDLSRYEGTRVLLPERFYEIASDATHKQLRSCGDQPPPLFLLQALVLTTYHELVIGVRGLAWRSLGLAIRIAYEMGLHLVDLPSGSTGKEGSKSVEVWIAKEERRRMWWTIWELEVFATTIRRCPISMDQSQHATLLPVEDTFWFEGKKAPSCFLDADPMLRAWFILINSFMCDAHSLANPSVPQCVTFGRGQPSGTQRHSRSADIDPRLVVLENCVSCFSMALPKQLQYRSDISSLNGTTSRDSTTRKRGSDIQAIYVMTQLAKLMILHNDCFRDERSGASSQTEEADATTHINALSPKYLHAAEQVVSTVRDATPHHISDGDPLLANTFWMVAAIQIIQATFAEMKSERLVAQSNLDLLCLTLILHRDFWNTSSVLVQNLDNLEDAMEKVHSRMISLGAIRSQPCTHPLSPDEERVPYGNSNSKGGLDLEPLMQGQDALGESQETEMCQNSGVISFDGEIQPRDTTLDGDSSNGFSTDLSMEAIISGVWGSSNAFFYNNDILENLNDGCRLRRAFQGRVGS